MTSLSRTAREFYHQPHGIGPGSVMRACDARPSDYVRCATLNWNASKESRGFFSGATPRLLDVLRRYHGADGESLKINTQKLRPGLSEALTIRAASAALTQTFTNAARPITNNATPKNPVASVSIKLNSHQVGISNSVFVCSACGVSSCVSNRARRTVARQLRPLTELAAFSPSRGSEFLRRPNSIGRATRPRSFPRSQAPACALATAGSRQPGQSPMPAKSFSSWTSCAPNTPRAARSSNNSNCSFRARSAGNSDARQATASRAPAAHSIPMRGAA